MSNFVDNIQQCFAAFPAMFEFVLKVKVMGSNPGYLLKSFLLYLLAKYWLERESSSPPLRFPNLKIVDLQLKFLWACTKLGDDIGSD